MLNQYGGGQFDLIKDFEKAGMPKPEDKNKAPKNTVADRMIADMYRKIDEAKQLEKDKKPVTMVSIKGIMDEIKAMGEEEKNNENKNNE